MPAPPLSKADLRRTARILRKHKGDRYAAAAELEVTRATVDVRVSRIRRELPDEKLPPNNKVGTKPMAADEMAKRMGAIAAAGGNVRQAALDLRMSRGALEATQRSAAWRDDWKPVGKTAAQKARTLPLPKSGKVNRYILTCAQSGTKLHEPTWNALNRLSEHYSARLLVSTFSYVHRHEGSAKRGTAKVADTESYDPRIEPFATDDMVAVAPSLVFNGHMNILPTAVDPLSGMDNYNGRHSSIFPHAKQHMKSIATTVDAPAKLQYTTGAATQLNYIAKKAGQKAEFDHVFGGLLVEVNSAGEWWARQLITDNKGRMYDLDVVAMPDGSVVPSVGAAALVFGDLHAIHLTQETLTQRWGEGGMVAALQPTVQIAHDILDFESRSHHNRRDPHKMFDLHVKRRESVRAEVANVGDLLSWMTQHGKVVVANSNHDRHLERWLKEADWRTDPVNAEFFVDCQKAYLTAIRAGSRFDALKWAVAEYSPVKGVKFLAPGESFVVCRDRSGGVELGLHGDLGPGGSRGSIRNLARIGRRTVIGHSHSAGIHNGCFQVGVTAPMSAFDYARGAPGSWSHTDCVVYANGKRALLTWWKGRWRA